MTAAEALAAYGYIQRDDGRYVYPGKPRYEQWQATDGGWLRFDLTDAGYTPMAYAIEATKAAYGQLVDIGNPDDHAFCNLVWPEDEVGKIYSHAAEQKAADWPDANAE